MYVTATSSRGVAVSFTTSAFDLVSGTVPTTASIASGSLFPIGTTLVTVTATDGAGNTGTNSFDVTVLPLPFVKADNSIALSQTTSWTGGVVPGAADIALWSGNYASTSTPVSVGSGLTAERLQFSSLNRAITISPGTGSLNLIGVSGTSIDMSASGQGVTLACPVLLGSGGSQNWTIENGQILTVSGNISDGGLGDALIKSGGGTVIVTGSCNYSGVTTIGAGTFQIGNGTATPWTLSGGVGIASGATLDLDTILSGTTAGAISGAGTLKQSSTSGIITVCPAAGYSGTIGTVTGVSGGTLILGGSPSASTTISNILNNTGFTADFVSGTWNLDGGGSYQTNIVINGGTVNRPANTGDFYNVAAFTIHGGVYNGFNQYGMRMGSTYGPSDNSGQTTVCTQDGGVVTVSGNDASIGSSTPNVAESFALTGGTFNLINSHNFVVGSGTSGTGFTLFTLGGTGKMIVNAGTIYGSQGNGAQQIFAFTGGTLAANEVDATYLSGTAAPAQQGTFYNCGGTLAPGDIGTAGKMTITGNYAVTSSNAVLAIDIGGATQAAAFQTGTGQYDYVSVTGSASLSGTLLVSLINGFVPTNSQTFTVLNSSSTLSGSFINLTSGKRVITADGGGSLLVSSTGNKITLSSYAAIAPPTITAQPVSATVNQGMPVTLSVSATATNITPITYQWRIGGNPIESATSSTYMIAAARPTDAGSYDVVVANTAGSVTSSTATITVNLPPPAPTGVAAGPGNGVVALAWNASAGATSYKVKRGTTSGTYGTIFGNIATNSYSDTSVTNETTYYYIVTAVNSIGESSPSTEVTCRPVLPFAPGETNAPAMTISGSTATITLPTVAGRTYQLQRSNTLAPGSWINIGSPVTGTGLSLNLQDPAATGATQQFYRVQITQ